MTKKLLYTEGSYFFCESPFLFKDIAYFLFKTSSIRQQLPSFRGQILINPKIFVFTPKKNESFFTKRCNFSKICLHPQRVRSLLFRKLSSPQRVRSLLLKKLSSPQRVRSLLLKNLSSPQRVRSLLFKKLSSPQRVRSLLFRNLASPQRVRSLLFKKSGPF
jgi:hypothetical protein